MLKKPFSIFLFVFLFLSTFGQTTQPVYQGQGETREIDTSSRAIEKQEKRKFAFETDQVYFSNQFDGARLNNIERTAENSYKITILSENAPINMSRGMPFRFGRIRKEITVKLSILNLPGTLHPKLVKTEKWKPLKSKFITEYEKGSADLDTQSRPQRSI